MVKVEIKLFANLREAAGKETIFLDFAEDPTVENVLSEIVRKEPGLRKYLFIGDDFNDHYKVLAGNEIVFPEDFSKPLSGSKLAILPPVSGG